MELRVPFAVSVIEQCKLNWDCARMHRYACGAFKLFAGLVTLHDCKGAQGLHTYSPVRLWMLLLRCAKAECFQGPCGCKYLSGLCLASFERPLTSPQDVDLRPGLLLIMQVAA